MKRKMVPLYDAKDYCSGKASAKPVGWMSDPDEIGPVFVDFNTLMRLAGKDRKRRNPVEGSQKKTNKIN